MTMCEINHPLEKPGLARGWCRTLVSHPRTCRVHPFRAARKALALLLTALLTLPTAALGTPAPPPGTPTTKLAPVAGAGAIPAADEATRARVRAGLGKLPLDFIENRGQVDSRVAYYVQGASTSVYLTLEGIVFTLVKRAGSQEGLPGRKGAGSSPAAERWAVRLAFEGANPHARITGQDRTSAVVSYFTGDRSRWKTGLPTYGSVVYEELWPGIDLVYEGDAGQLKYTFLVKPGADPGRIRLRYEGATEVRRTEEGGLRVETPAGGFEEQAPYAYQGEAERAEVQASFDPSESSPTEPYRFGFHVGAYDRTRLLVLDPVVLTYCGYIGGSALEESWGMTVDSAGNAYVVGRTQSAAASFPDTAGAWDQTFGGTTDDAFVAEVNAAGNGLVYCTYLGGTAAGAELAYDVAVDGSGNAYVAGVTTSADFPTLTGPDTSFNGGGADAFVTKLNAGGGSLAYSGFIGGGTLDEGYAIAIDGSGNAYVAGRSNSTTGFPLVGGPGLTQNGGYDGWVAKVRPTGAGPLLYCGYIGGTLDDSIIGIAVDGAGNAYVSGPTLSTQAQLFPVLVGPDLFYNGGSQDGFVAKLDSTGLLVYCGYVGGAGVEEVTALAVDSAGNLYMSGTTSSTEATFPVTVGPDLVYNGGSLDGFVGKLNPSGTAFVYLGYIGGTGGESAKDVAIDTSGRAFVTGNTDTADGSFPARQGPDVTYNGGAHDAYVAMVNVGGTALIFCSYIGGTQDDQSQGIGVDPSGNVYAAGFTSSTSAQGFPATSLDTSYNGSQDAWVAKINVIAELYRSVGVNAASLNTGSRTVQVVGETATFSGAMPANVGVGDVLQYQVAATYYLAFISGRTSDTVYTVQSAAGGTPQAAVAGTAVGVYRAYNSLFKWEAQDENDTLDNSVEDFDTSTSLVALNAMVNVACYGDGADTTAVLVDGWTTAAADYIRIFTPTSSSEVGTSQRHPGKWDSTRYRLEAPLDPLAISSNYVRVEGLQVYVTANVANNEGIGFTRAGDSGTSYYEVSANIVRGTPGDQDARIGINPYNAGNGIIKIWNNLVYDFSGNTNFTAGILLDDAQFTHYVYNNTVVDCGNGIYLANGTVVAKNNLVFNNADNYYLLGGALFDAASTNNLSNLAQSDAPGSNPRHVAAVTFVNYAGDDFHLAAADTGARSQGVDLSADANLAFANDIDGRPRPAPWDIGADDYTVATAVRLSSFQAVGRDSSVSVGWETASELDNLGFHLFRGLSADGPWDRLTQSLIPGLGSSPEGKSYSYLDAGLRNGATYYYRLEDVDRSGSVTSHGPVSAMPLADSGEPEQPGAPAPTPAPGVPGETPGGGGNSGSTQTPSTAGWIARGDPADVSLREVGRTRSSVTYELRTGGFYSVAQEDGSQKLFVPGFFDLAEPGLPTLPTRGTWTDAVPGLGARIASVKAEDVISFDGLLPPRAGAPQALALSDGTYQATFRHVHAAALGRGLYPTDQARVVQTAFQGDVKKAYLELAPLRFDASRGRLVLARRLLVTVVFDGVVRGETSLGGSSGRSLRRGLPRRSGGRVLARLVTHTRGLHRLSWEDLLAATSSPGALDVAPSARTLPTSALRLSRHGETVPFHVEPWPDRFVPGSTLLFLSDGPEAAYTNDAVFELAVARGGTRMAVGPSRGHSSERSQNLTSLLTSVTFEKNLEYLPALLDAADFWLWSGFLSGTGVDYPFAIDSPAPGPAKILVRLQGASDTDSNPDHRVRLSINAIPLAEGQWDGLSSFSLEADVPPGVLLQGPNSLRLDGLGVASSAVYLDRFTLDYPETLASVGGVLEGRAPEDGFVQASGFDSGAVLLDLSERVPRWIGRSGSGLAFSAERDHHYLAVAPGALLQPVIRPVSASSLHDPSNQADWILVAPRELLPAAEPLLLHRQGQGLSSIAVSIEEIYDSFSYGEPSPQALHDFLAFAYHHWSAPSPRYVFLLGDASYDPKGFLTNTPPGTTRKDLIPSPLVRSSYLWAPSDPSLASVNGDDLLPDLALGRITAGSLAEATSAVQKILDFERSSLSLSGKAVLVADNPDLAGDFEANVNDIASLLPSRTVEKIFLSQLGAPASKAAVLGAFDSGASLVSYIGHGSSGIWASEGILRSADVALLHPQPLQPFVLTMTCSNGFFTSPWNNALIERFVLAPEKGAIAAFSPSGLSLDQPAHLYHRALASHLESGSDSRIGDLVLAAQLDYLKSGAFPELLSLYHLFADPALRIRE